MLCLRLSSIILTYEHHSLVFVDHSIDWLEPEVLDSLLTFIVALWRVAGLYGSFRLPLIFYCSDCLCAGVEVRDQNYCFTMRSFELSLCAGLFVCEQLSLVGSPEQH